MTSPGDKHAVAVFARHQDAEAAIIELQKSGFDMKKLSIVGRDYHTEEHPIGFYNAPDRVKVWGKRGAFWGTVFGILLAPAFFWIPGIGPVLTGGLIGSFLMGTLEGAAVGAALGAGSSALAGALAGLGIPQDSVIRYESDIKQGRFLLIATGSPEDLSRARAIMGAHGSEPEVSAS